MSDGIRNIEKGNTEIIAEMIKDITGAELFKVEAAKEYPYNYRQCTDVALQEKNENARPELKKYLDNIDEYEVIYIGYPNWWGTMPMPMFTQLEKLDFTGKIIKPFATNAGWLGHTFQEIQKLCPDSKVEKGMNIVFTENYNENQLVTSLDEVVKWIQEL